MLEQGTHNSEIWASQFRFELRTQNLEIWVGQLGTRIYIVMLLPRNSDHTTQTLDLNSILCHPVYTIALSAHNLDLKSKTLDPEASIPDPRTRNSVMIGKKWVNNIHLSRMSLLKLIRLSLPMNLEFGTQFATSWKWNLGHQSYLGVDSDIINGKITKNLFLIILLWNFTCLYLLKSSFKQTSPTQFS